MSELRIGSLFSGYLGLDLAVREVLPNAETVFVADIDPGACKVLAHRAPGAPNLGDVSNVDWASLRGAIEIITAGFPCQDVSSGGKRAGLMKGTRTGLWHETARAIDELRPQLVLLENVRGLLSARGDEPTAAHLASEATAHAAKNLTHWLDSRHVIAVRQGRTDHARALAARRVRAMGCRKRALARARRHERHLVRALGTVLGSLADIGYDAAWCGLRAADVGAPHGRWRIFILAWPTNSASIAGSSSHRDGLPTTNPECGGPGRWATQLHRPPVNPAGDGAGTLLPSPAAYDGERGGAQHPDKRKVGGHSVSLQDAIHSLLPSPRATDGTKGGPNQRGSSGDLMLPSAVAALLPTPATTDGGSKSSWGKYADAIHRWEQVTRPAPAPTETGPKGNPRLSCHFDEWLMGLPAGWITDIPGVTHQETLKLCGNGVVFQQGAAAFRWLLGVRANVLACAA